MTEYGPLFCMGRDARWFDMMYFLAVYLLSLIFNNVQAKIPEYIHVCKKNDPELNKCILDSIEALRPKLIEGIPELDIPAIEPLHLPEIVLSRGNTFHAIGTDIVVHGASNFIINELKVDVDKLEFVASLHFPAIDFNATYDVDAKLMAMPLKGKGPLTANATDIEGKATVKGHKQTEDGRTFVVFNKLQLKLKMKNYQLRLENLFNGDKKLGDAINLLLNENKREMMNIFRPQAEEMASAVLLERANKITKHFDYDELFPAD